MNLFTPSFKSLFSSRLDLCAWLLSLSISGLAVLLACNAFLIYLNPEAAPIKKHEVSKKAQVLFLGNSQHSSIDIDKLCCSALNVVIGNTK